MRGTLSLLLLSAPALGAAGRSSGGPATPAAVPAGLSAAAPAGLPSLPPLLVGDLNERGNPVRERLEARAAQLLELSPAGVPASAAAVPLGALIVPSAHPTDRLAARVLAEVAVSGESSRRLLDLYPVLRTGPVAAVHGTVVPDDPYRGSVSRASSLASLAEEAGRDPAVRAVFDGAGAGGDLLLWDLGLDGKGLRLGGERLKPKGFDQPGADHEHPRAPGVVLKAARGREAWQDHAATEALGRAGAGPRFLGRVGLEGASVHLKERVYGESLWDIIRGHRLSAEDHALVGELFDRLAEEGLDPESLEKTNLFLGGTYADPRRRALLLDAGGLRGSLSPMAVTTAAERRALLDSRSAFDRMDVIHGGETALPDPVYTPWGDILREGLYWGTRPSLWRRLSERFRRKS